MAKWHWYSIYPSIPNLICHAYSYFLLYSYSLIERRRYVLRATLNTTPLRKDVIFSSFMKVYICSRHFAYNAPYSLFVSRFLHETTRALTSYSYYMSVDNTVQNFILLVRSVL